LAGQSPIDNLDAPVFAGAFFYGANAMPPRKHEIDAEPAGNTAVSPQQRHALALGIHASVQNHLAAVQRVLDVLRPADHAEAESTARTLAALSQSLRDVAALNVSNPVTTPDEADDDPIPRDIDEFRRELARRIRGFIEARSAGAAGIPDLRKSEVD
jgi:hypothetical protein